VILDFWTYGCINCLHVAEELKELEEEFGDHLVVIGVHTPKFDNEKDLRTLKRNVLRYDLRHPVVQDEDALLMAAYAAPAWPTLSVIDPEGRYLARTTGEGKIELLRELIERVLEVHAGSLDDEPLPLVLEQLPEDEALLAGPGKVAANGTWVAISDTLNHRVVVADPTGQVKAVCGDGDAGFEDGAFASAKFKSPQGLATDGDRIYVADAGNHAVRLIDMETRRVSTIAGTGEKSLYPRFSGDGDARALSLRSPWALAREGEHLYIAMAGSHQIWRLDLTDGRMGPWAGSGREGIDDGPLARASFSQPSGLALSGRMLYVADAEASAIRRIDLDAGEVATLVGEGLFEFGDRDGSFDQAQLQHPSGILVEAPASLMIADTYNHKLKRLDMKDAVVSSLLGDGKPGDETGDAGLVRLNEPSGLALLEGQLLIADTNNDRLVLFDPRTSEAVEWPLTWPAAQQTR